MTATVTMTTGLADGEGTHLFGSRGPRGPRGRHRKPRPRKVLLAAGGLALAAGALSLVRLTPDTTVGGFGATDTDPQAAPDTDIGTGTDDAGTDPRTDRATNAAATIGSVPKVSPSSTAVMGGISATPTAGAPLAPTASASASAVPQPFAAAPTTIPDAPNAPAPAPTATTAPHAPTTTAAPQPHPAPTTAPTTPAPAPTAQPTQSTRPAPGLCVPIIGLCVQQR